jgi:hypothetical protein
MPVLPQDSATQSCTTSAWMPTPAQTRTAQPRTTSDADEPSAELDPAEAHARHVDVLDRDRAERLRCCRCRC